MSAKFCEYVGRKRRSDDDGERVLLKDREEQEYLLAISRPRMACSERLIVRQKVDGGGWELNSNAQGTWQPRTQKAISAVLEGTSSGYGIPQNPSRWEN